MKGLQAYALSKRFTEETADAFGALKGAPCEVVKVDYDHDAGTVTITLSWTSKSGVVETEDVVLYDGEKGEQGDRGIPGLGIESVKVNANEHLIVTYDDGTTEDAGKINATGGIEFTDNGDESVVISYST